jgi:hypothetical protein
MLIWLNGPFGGGKTQTAFELARRLPGSVVCDPEQVGFGLQRMMPRGLRSDFQDLRAWRQGVREVLDLVLSEQGGTVIAPMTLVEPGYFQEIVGELRESGHDVRHFALLASRETVLRRLEGRAVPNAVLAPLGGRSAARHIESFAVRHLDRCLAGLAGPEFAEHVHTDALTVPQVADRVAASAGLALRPADRSALRGKLRRAWVGVRHIRFV